MSTSHVAAGAQQEHQSFIYRTIYAAWLTAALMLALSGCAAIETKLGARVNLAKIPVVSMQVAQEKGPGIAAGITPGGKSSLIVTFTQPDGKTLTTEGAGHGKVMWKDLTVTPMIVTAKKGVVSLSPDPRVSEDKMPHVAVAAPSHPEMQASELDIPVRYDGKFSAYFAGTNGFDGMNGTDGMDGISGTPGSIDPNNPSPGGNGTNGSNGSDGGNGGDGSNGPPVHVTVKLKPGNHPLLQVVVAAENTQKFFLVDPQGGSLTVSSEGGSAGSGGKGGRGGRGGAGGTGTPNGSSGMDGTDGRNGFAGSPGHGGSIEVTYDPSAFPYLSTIHLSNDGGTHPAFVQQNLPLLW